MTCNEPIRIRYLYSPIITELSGMFITIRTYIFFDLPPFLNYVCMSLLQLFYCIYWLFTLYHTTVYLFHNNYHLQNHAITLAILSLLSLSLAKSHWLGFSSSFRLLCTFSSASIAWCSSFSLGESLIKQCRCLYTFYHTACSQLAVTVNFQ